MHNDYPELLKDRYWNEIPQALPDRVKDIVHEPHANDGNVVHSQFFQTEVKLDVAPSYLMLPIREPSMLVPNAAVISGVYDNIPHMREEQREINEIIEKQRLSSISHSSHEKEK